MQEVNEAKKPAQSSYSGPPVVFKLGSVFKETAVKHSIDTPGVKEALENFKKAKSENPLAPYGGKDYKLGNHFEKAVPGMLHAGLTNNVSVFYTLSGANPKVIHLHGVFNHDEAGIGQPANINRQKSSSKRMSNQEFLN